MGLQSDLTRWLSFSHKSYLSGSSLNVFSRSFHPSFHQFQQCAQRYKSHGTPVKRRIGPMLHLLSEHFITGLPLWLSWWRIHLQCGSPGFNPWVEDRLRRERLPTQVFWPGEFHGLYSPWGRKESDMTEWLSLSFHFSHLTMPWGIPTIISRGG